MQRSQKNLSKTDLAIHKKDGILGGGWFNVRNSVNIFHSNRLNENIS